MQRVSTPHLPPARPGRQPSSAVTPAPGRGVAPRRVLTPDAVAPAGVTRVWLSPRPVSGPAGVEGPPALTAPMTVEQLKLQFSHSFGGDPSRIKRATELADRAYKKLARLKPNPAVASPPVHQGRSSDPIDVMALLNVYKQIVPASWVQNHEHSLKVMELLVLKRVGPAELQALFECGKSRDMWRSLASAELLYALSFGAGTAASMLLAGSPLLSADGADPQATSFAADFNTGAGFMLAGGIIAVGAEAGQAMIREGKMGGPRYNTPYVISGGVQVPLAGTEAEASRQRRSALPFGLLYAMDDVARHQTGTPPALRLAAGAGAAALSALYKLHGAPAAGGTLVPAWLGPPQFEGLDRSIDDLRQTRWEAIKGYAQNHVWPGAKASAAEVFSEKGVVRMVGRLCAATVARAGSVLSTAAGATGNLSAQVGAEAWLGLSWGTLSMWPQRLLDGAALGRAKESGAPVVARAPADAVAPPGKSPVAGGAPR